MRRRFEANPDPLEFPVFGTFVAAGATDYFGQLFAFGTDGDRSHGSGIVYSFVTDRIGGFSDDDETLLHATLPALSLAMKADAGHVIAAGLLGTYLGEDAGRRVHAGAVERGSVSSLRAVLWYADVRGFTPTSDAASGPVIVELLNDVFETMTAALRSRGGQVLKFIGDGMLATFSFEDAEASQTCLRALDAAKEAARELDALNGPRSRMGAPAVAVDIALHVGEVLYGNVGATDRLDFTVIGPAVNEVARIEALCEPLGRSILVSAEFVAAIADGDSRLISLGRHALRGVKRDKEVFAVDL
jgi:adenylate cyclase